MGISEDIPATELYDLLHKYRSSQHPDKYDSDDIKKVAEERFKNLNNLLQELAIFIEKDKLQKKPNEVIPYQKDYDLVKSKNANIRKEEEIEKLKSEIYWKERQIKELKSELKNLRSEKVDIKTKELVNLYKPSKRSLLSMGLTFLLTVLLGVLSKIDEIAAIVYKYSPINIEILNYVIFSVIIIIPVNYIRMMYEENLIQSIAKKIKTPLYINMFFKYLVEKDTKKHFTEMDVYDFLAKQLFPKNKISRFLNTKIIKLYSEITIDSLKSIFIYNLLHKQFIKISSANELDRNFEIIKAGRYFFMDDDDDDDELNF